ncbi:MAG: prolyl oligopeptidase [Limisphaerales bacterium]
MEKDGETPVLIYTYGGFGVSTKPNYNSSFALWLEHGGILAVPLVRGGGELGKGWHDAGNLLNKQNGIDDFIYAAEHLISSGYTSNHKIGTIGGSNGGLVIATAFTQRPDLFSVAIIEAGVLDMLRYELFTVGNQYIREYGSAKKKVEFENLYSYSPLHNLVKGKDYPTVLLTAALFDDRVPPHHSYKFLAQLQLCELPNENKPSLIYIEERGGHSGEATPDAYYTKKAFTMGFLFKNLGIKFRKN